jgi:hypothetical protein
MIIENPQLFIIDVIILCLITYELFLADKVIIFPSLFTLFNRVNKNKKNKN